MKVNNIVPAEDCSLLLFHLLHLLEQDSVMQFDSTVVADLNVLNEQ